jgi:ribosomal protein S27AE
MKIWEEYEKEKIKNKERCPKCKSLNISATSLDELICLDCGFVE